MSKKLARIFAVLDLAVRAIDLVQNYWFVFSDKAVRTRINIRKRGQFIGIFNA